MIATKLLGRLAIFNHGEAVRDFHAGDTQRMRSGRFPTTQRSFQSVIVEKQMCKYMKYNRDTRRVWTAFHNKFSSRRRASVNAVEIYRLMSIVYGNMFISKNCVQEWCRKLTAGKGRKSVATEDIVEQVNPVVCGRRIHDFRSVCKHFSNFKVTYQQHYSC